MKTKHYLILGFLLCFFIKLSATENSDINYFNLKHIDFYVSDSTVGGKIFLPILECRYYKDKEDYLFGIDYFSPSSLKNIFWNIKTGNISPSGIYSKLKNPMLNSSITPFSSVATSTSPLTAPLPSATSSFSTKKNESLYVQLSFYNKALKTAQASFYTSPSEQISIAGSKIDFAFNSNIISFSTCAGYFDYSSNESSSWFLKESFYHSGTHFCNMNQLSYKNPFFSILFSLGFYETPFNTFEQVYRTETQLKIKHFVLNGAGVFLPETILTSSDDTFSNIFQLKTGFQYNSIFGKKQPVFLRSGFNTYSKINLLTKEQNLKFTLGFQFTFPLYSLNASSGINFNSSKGDFSSINITFDSASFSLQNSWFLKKFSPSLAFSCSYNPSTDNSSISTGQSVSVDLSSNTNPKFSVKNKITFSQKNYSLEKRTFSSSFLIKGTYKCISITCKIGLSLEH